MEKVDITIIGAGIIGLAISHALSDLEKDINVIEKNPSFGQETSSRNSEVIHAGIYYPKNSVKAKTCIRGKKLLYELCSKQKIPYKKLGKLVVAYDKEGISSLDSIYKNAAECGVNNLSFLDRKDIKKMEPDVEAERAIYSPEAGIFDSHAVMKFFFEKAKKNGVNLAFSIEVINIEKKGSFYEIVVKEPQGDAFSFQTKFVINCAGLLSDKVAKLVGIDVEKASYKIHYCKGQYFRTRNPEKFSISHLIYPPPTEVDLGIHVTPDLGGGLRLGPDAKYVKDINYDIDNSAKRTFFDSLSKFLPSLDINDLIPDTAGVRPKLQAETENFRDFVIKEEAEKGFPNFINLLGIESPGLTSSLAIAETVKNIVGETC